MLTIQGRSLPRADALRRIRLLSGKDLRPLAEQYGVTVWKNGHKNKGWAGQVIEQYLGLPQNSLQAPDFGSWELKVVPLIRTADGMLRVKESMAITMIEPAEVVASRFADSHLYGPTDFPSDAIDFRKLLSEGSSARSASSSNCFSGTATSLKWLTVAA